MPSGQNHRNGFDYGSNKQFAHFLKIAKGSASEVRAQLIISSDIGYVTEEKEGALKQELKNLSSQIAGFIKYLESLDSK